jgi:TolB-like protein/class 3 adenylate cyclase/tetratricopeptide (TPR) repeat protein
VTPNRIERRLAAILSADMVGYSRHIEDDETGTISRQQVLRGESIDPRIVTFGGRIVKTMGDGLLVEFGSAVDAVDCAVDIQQALALLDLDLPETQRIRYRIGVNIGDIIIDGDDILGDGVNIAARLEGLAEHGGVAISDNAHEQTLGKLAVNFSDGGAHEVKNISRPLHVWRWCPETTAAPIAIDSPSNPVSGPDKSSIAVLPFDNMSGDPEQEYFADGITEDIITALSNVKTFTVLARNSTFVYKGKSVDVQELGRILQVRYVVEGSVRRSGNRVRVTAQLIDASNGSHIWADRYDGALDDIFDLQDRITSTIVGTIEPALVRAEGLRLMSKPPDNLDAYDHLLRGVDFMHRLTPEDTQAALACFEKAFELDPNYGRAYVFASWCYRRIVDESGMVLSDADRDRAIDLARRAVRCGRDDPFVLAYAGCTLYQIERNEDEALALIDQALTLNPNSLRFWTAKSRAHSQRGDTEAAINAAEHAITISPHEPAIWNSYFSLAEAHFQELRFEDAIDFAKRATRQNERLGPGFHILAAAAAQLGHEEDAKSALTAALRVNPGMTLETFQTLYPVGRLKNLDVYLDGLRKAGLPES